jgi:small subunit ribosomal protein S6
MEKQTVNNYEGLFIVRPDLNEEGAKQTFKAITDSIAKQSGSVKKDESWGKRQLTFSIRKFRDGYYYKVDFEAPPAAIAKLREAYKLNMDILRSMITKR